MIDDPRRPRRWRHLPFIALAAASLLPGVSPALALGAGALFGLTLGNPFGSASTRLSKWLLQVCVVGLGFGMSLPVVLEVGAHGVLATALGIAFALGLGFTLTRLLRVEPMAGALISGGTAICGGSAIAALGPALGASAQAMGIALATVFVLNGVALYLFPVIGHALGLTQHQFSLWAAIAIHDTSSVVGAAAAYGNEALAQATVFKLTRALWIVPVAIGAALWRRRARGGDVQLTVPWFIAFFALASALRAVVPAGRPIYDVAAACAHRGLVLTLFLIGAGLDRETLRRVGPRPLIHGALLWLTVAGGTLAAILRFG